MPKFLDETGVQHLWNKISMEDYPNNETLMAVINAIDETKMDKDELHKIATSGNWEDLENRTHYYGYPTITINLDPEKDFFNSEKNVFVGGYGGSTDPVEFQKGIEIGNIFLDQGEWAVLPATLIFDDIVFELEVPRRLPVVLSLTDNEYPKVYILQHGADVGCAIEYNDNQKHTFTWIAKTPSFKTLSEKFIPHSIARSTDLNNKVDRIDGKGLSTNDYTTEEKEKLANISAGAEVNQNAFGQVKIDTTTITADSKTDTLTFVAGNNITLTPDATNDKITIAAQDTTYSAATTSAAGLMSAADKSKLDGIATGANKITVDTSLSSSSTNPVQNKIINTALSEKVPSTRTINGKALSSNITLNATDVGAISTSAKGAANGVAELDNTGKIPTSQLPSYVDDVIEAANLSSFPTTGETGKIYVAIDTNKTYRWSGSAYTEISASLALGTTSSTAYRGDRGNAAYAHGVTNKGTALTSGLYKITANNEGHITAGTAVTKSDITALGIPAQDTTYSAATTSAAGLMSAADKTKLDSIATGANKTTVDTAMSTTSTNPVQNKVVQAAITAASNTATNNFNKSITGLSVSGKTVTYTKGDGTTGTITTQDTNTDTNVTQTVTTSNAAYPLLLAPSGQTATKTTTSYFDSGVTLNPSTNTIAANISGNAGTATKLATARTISLTGDVTGSASFDGSANASITATVADNSHNHDKTTITSVYDTRINWGGDNVNGGVSPIGSALSAEHNANRLAYLNPNAVSVEYSDNNGSTWTAMSVADSTKIGLVTTSGTISIGNSSTVSTNQKTRITFTAQDGTNSYVYTRPRKMLINVNSYDHTMNVKLETKTGASNASWTTIGTYAVSGWSGWNDIPITSFSTFGGNASQKTNVWYIRLTFSITAVGENTSSKSTVLGVRLFGDTCWTRASNMGETGHLYAYDIAQNATFPAKVTATSFEGSGASLTSLNASNISSGTIAAARLPAATTSAQGAMSAADKTKLDGIATGANKITVDTALSSTSTNPVQNKVINTALGGKQATITGAATTITGSNLTASRALVSDTNGKVAVSAVTSTELGYLDGVTSAIQTQLNGKAPTSHASTATTYGAASASNYGHAMASSTTPKANGTAAVGSETAKFARGDHVHPLQTSVGGVTVKNAAFTTGFADTYRTSVFGGTNISPAISVIRTDTANVNNAPQYGAGLAWARGDTHGYLNVGYNGDGTAFIGGGNADKLNWVKQVAFTDSNVASASKLANTRYIDGVSFTGEANVTRYATCSTAANTAAKTAAITAGTFSLITGARVTVKFTNANSAASPTLNVGSTGAKAIYWHGAALASSQYWQAGAVLDFVYNGTQWDLVSVAKDNNTTYSVATTSANGLMSKADKTTLDTLDTLVGDTSVSTQISNAITDAATATTSSKGLMSAADKTKLNATNIAYGTCSTAAATAAKVITISGNTNWTLAAGSMITIKFSATNTAQNPTFNVNNTGAKKVWYNTALITTGSLSMAGTANRPMNFIYDGTQYVFIGWSADSNSTYSNAGLGQGYGTCTTAEATVAKAVTLSSYALTTGGIVSVKFTYAVPASATMNINSKGAKSIYYKGAAIIAGIIKAGDTATFIYDGTRYHLIAIDSSVEMKFANWSDTEKVALADYVISRISNARGVGF